MSTPAVSIGISFRNPGRHFPLALKSVFAQTFTDWELILLNDASDDGSLELAQRLSDKRVRVLSDGQGKPLNSRLNEMVNLSRGKYFFRMDADDVMHPDRIQKQIELLETCDSNTVAGSAAYSIDRDSNLLGIRGIQERQRTGFEARRSFHHPTVAAATEWFRCNPYSEAYIYRRAEDAELWCRTSGASRFIVMREPLMFYREGSSSFTAYMETELVLIHILHERFRTPLPRYLLSLSAELGKLWIACVMEAVGKGNAHVSRRYGKLTPKQAAAAGEVLNGVKERSLPLCGEAFSVVHLS